MELNLKMAYIDQRLSFAPTQRTECSASGGFLERVKVFVPVECDEPFFYRLVGQFWRRFNPHRIRSAIGKKERKKRPRQIKEKIRRNEGQYNEKGGCNGGRHKKGSKWKKKDNVDDDDDVNKVVWNFLRVQFLDAERVQYSGQWGQWVAKREVNSGPVEQIGQAGFFSGRQSAQCDGTPRFRIVRALTDQMVALNKSKSYLNYFFDSLKVTMRKSF